MPIWEGCHWVSLFKKACKCVDAGRKIFLVATMKKRLQPQQLQPCIAAVHNWLTQSSAAQILKGLFLVLALWVFAFMAFTTPYPPSTTSTIIQFSTQLLLPALVTGFVQHTIRNASALRDCASSRARDNFRFRVQSAGERPAFQFGYATWSELQAHQLRVQLTAATTRHYLQVLTLPLQVRSQSSA